MNPKKTILVVTMSSRIRFLIQFFLHRVKNLIGKEVVQFHLTELLESVATNNFF